MLCIINRKHLNSIIKFTPIIFSHFQILNVIFYPFLFNCCPFSNNGTLFSTRTLFENGVAFSAPTTPIKAFWKIFPRKVLVFLLPGLEPLDCIFFHVINGWVYVCYSFDVLNF
ncbi:hypothetical protein V8G54_036456 [Vigna mungo]|uniref:Uncharacterized protein n=1 Tax=Vigna mungo TaxID=3915 RepID=A0AAQ3RFM8_VIGMU